MDDINRRISEIRDQIDRLPAGSIGKKTIKGRVYYYHRWTEEGKRKEKYIPVSDIDVLRASIEQRRALQDELRSLQALAPMRSYSFFDLPGGYGPFQVSESTDFDSYNGTSQGSGDSLFILTGERLKLFSNSVSRYKKRGIYLQLADFLYGDFPDKVLVLYGLRRTGKTTMIRQAISDMEPDDLMHTAFIQTGPAGNLASLNACLRSLLDRGFKYVFIDEVTLMDDFIEGAALFSDIYAACGMKIVLSGTDSLGFVFAEDEQLYDRCRFIHTTFIPYCEFEEVLNIRGIDEYIRFGGTMSLSGRDYNRNSAFAGKVSTNEYVESSIARNIQHSLKNYQYGGHFRALQDLYDKDELTGAVNRVVEDINHRFAVDVLTRKFKSHDLSLSAANQRRDRKNPIDVPGRIETEEVVKRFAELLEIKDRESQNISLEDVHVREIKQCLDRLEITADIPVVDMDHLSAASFRTVITQPGLRYSQADALLSGLLRDEVFSNIAAADRSLVLSRIRDGIKERMMEEIVLYETAKAFPDKEVFTLKFDVGEFDMVFHDPETLTCEIYEIRHSTQTDPEQYRHLIDQDKCAKTEFRFGQICKKSVLYRGNACTEAGIEYTNVESYLKSLQLENSIE